jgi:hypothetical protein
MTAGSLLRAGSSTLELGHYQMFYGNILFAALYQITIMFQAYNELIVNLILRGKFHVLDFLLVQDSLRPETHSNKKTI